MFAKLKKIRNWKTSLSGAIALLTPMLNDVGIVIPDSVTKWVTIIGAIAFVYFAKDKDVTGGSKPQTGEAEARTEIENHIIEEKETGYRKPNLEG